MNTDWIATWANLRPGQPAVKEADTGRVCTYDQLNQLGNQFALGLSRQYGLQKGDRIAVLAEWTIELVGLFCAAQKAGFILVPLNYRLAAAELAWQLSDSNPGLLLASAQFRSLLSEASDASLRLEVQLLEVLPTLFSGHSHFSSEPLENDHPIFILYTSGTTGRPKGAI